MHKLHVTQACLNAPPFIEKSITVALLITNPNSFAICNFTLINYIDSYGFTDNCYFEEDSAVVFYKGKKQSLKATTKKNKITLEGVKIPPREKIFVFYRLYLH